MSPDYRTPGSYVEELPSGVRTIAGVATSICAFVGRTLRGPLAEPAEVFSFAEYQRKFGAPDDECPMGYAVRDFFANGGSHAVILRLHGEAGAGEMPEGAGPALQEIDYLGADGGADGLAALRQADLFNLLCIPPDTPSGDTAPAVLQAALSLCVERRALLLVDPPAAWTDAAAVSASGGLPYEAFGFTPDAVRNAALYFPRLHQRDAAGRMHTRVPCGAVAGVIARTDSSRGVWKAPAGMEATLRGVDGLAAALDDGMTGALNSIAVNCLRTFPQVRLIHRIWGTRTLAGTDTLGSEYKYVPVRRLALFLEESIERGTRWAVFEPNDEPLWAQLRMNAGAFLHSLFRQGAFQDGSPREAYFVKCDRETTTAADLSSDVCIVLIGFAPLEPSEFVTLRIVVPTGRSNPPADEERASNA